jgi:energy-coupling factor transport system ATP-binding protein
MISIKNLEYAYAADEPATLKDINLHVNPGEMVAVIGQNGAGKSTLLRQLNGLSKPTRGTVTVAGLDTKTATVSEMAKHIGYLFQNPDHQIFCQTVSEEIQFGMKNFGVPEDEMNKRTEEIAELLDLSGKLASHPFTLSRGERQRTALAGVLAVRPKVLVLDEPTTGQDYRECIKIMDIVADINAKGTTVLMVSHDMEVVCDYARRIILMLDGKIIADGKAADILRRKDELAGTGLKPPQIIELALTLGGYENACTVDAMFDGILKRRQSLRGPAAGLHPPGQTEEGAAE